MSERAPNSDSVLTRLLAARETDVHLIGVSGVGMAGLARLLHARGFRVTGCDLVPGRPAEWLVAQGIAVRTGHDPSHIRPGTDWVVRSAAVPEDSPEVARAVERGIPVFTRGQVLPALLDAHVSVAVGGTHGKTTTSTFIALMLRGAGRDPGWCIGGEVCGPGTVAHVGADRELVVEADESDGTLALYHADISVVTNIEFDHMEHFEDEGAFRACFRHFAEQARRHVVYCLDDPAARALCETDESNVSYGFAEAAQVRAVAVDLRPHSASFDLTVRGESMGRVTLPVPGQHNVVNALAACAVGLELGLEACEVVQAMAGVSLPRRRFDRVVEHDGITVISDYAHHPSEIRALIGTAIEVPHRRLMAVFQPHRYTRTAALGEAFPPAFAGLDALILTPVYAASEQPLCGGTVWDLYERFAAPRRDDGGAGEGAALAVMVAPGLEQAWDYLGHRLAAEDLLLVIGAGDVEKLGGWAHEHIVAGNAEQPPGSMAPVLGESLPDSVCRADEPLADKTTLRVGGNADIWAQIGSAADLSRILAWTAQRDVSLRLLGGGSNVLVGDLGVRGVVARLAGADFRALRREGATFVAGGAVPVAKLLNALQEIGLSGLEFLQGIPGTVGGCLAMNAGAWGGTVGEQVSWIRCLNRDGTECILHATDLEWRYRDCPALASRVVVEAAFKAVEGDPGGISERRAGFAAKRAWLRGKHSAGSVFKNPEGDFAGRLLEDAGLKGYCVGGARVAHEHANVIETLEGATASDVMALVAKMRAAVLAEHGVHLQTEIAIWE